MIRKNRQWALLCLLMTVVLTGCIKEEPLNMECDILEAAVTVPNPTEVFFHESDSLVRIKSDENVVVFTVRSTADLTQMAPTFKLSEGAVIEPANGSVHDFSQGPVIYHVTSQDGQWDRYYVVRFMPVTVTVTETVAYDFEHYRLDSNYLKFYEWYEEGDDLEDGIWATGNGGFFLANSSKAADAYPTVPLEEGVEGHGVMLRTLDTGPLGHSTGRPIAAGNLFLGDFNTQLALLNALRSTEMGVPFTSVPVKLTGYYKYKPGEVYTNKLSQTVPELRDSADIYSVLYRNHDADGNAVVLYGDNVLTSDLIVRKARIEEVKVTDEWTYFEIDYEQLGEVDKTLLAERGYNLALVFSSSIHGDLFEGAVGSTLLIDKIRIICTHDE